VASGLVTRPPFGVPPPCGVKPKHGLRRGANLPARQEGDRRRAGRQAGAVDDDRFAADARRLEPLHIVDDRTTRIADDPHGCASGRNRNRGGSNADKHQADVAHLPILSPIRKQRWCLRKGSGAPAGRALSATDLWPTDVPDACVRGHPPHGRASNSRPARAKECRAWRPRIRTALPGSTVVLKPCRPGKTSTVRGNTAVVGGSNDSSRTGAVSVYTRTGGIWTQQGSKLVGSGIPADVRQTARCILPRLWGEGALSPCHSRGALRLGIGHGISRHNEAPPTYSRATGRRRSSLR
jgi:hypothetical protein